MHLKSGRKVAIKLMSQLFDSIYSSKKLISEIQILRKFTEMRNNVFTTKILDVIAPTLNADKNSEISHIFIVMEYVESDLNKVLR